MTNNQSKKDYSKFIVTNKLHVARQAILKITSQIKEPHCFICGDTQEDLNSGEKFKKVNTDSVGRGLLCPMCYNCQMNM